MQCKYEYLNEKQCHREALEGSEKGYCILHEDWENKDEEEVRKIFYQEIGGKVGIFEGCVLPGFDLSKQIIKQDLKFIDAKIKGGIELTETTIEGKALLNNAEISGSVTFDRLTIKGNIWFLDTKIKGGAFFREAVIKDAATFSFKEISSLTFKNAKFENMPAQEEACREAKIVNERRGDKELADYHFYREMKAKKNQLGPEFNRKDWPFGWRKKLNRWREIPSRIKWTDWKGWLQLPQRFSWFLADLTTAFGTSWFRVLISWLFVISGFGFGFIFSNYGFTLRWQEWGKGLYFSLAAFTTLGYGNLAPQSKVFQVIFGIESVIGGFLMAAFVLVFARKFMR